MMSKAVSAVLFDLDGTLLNTLEDIGGAMNHVLRSYSLPEWPLPDYRYLVGNGAVRLAERAVRGRTDLLEPVLADYMAFYSAHSLEKTRPYPGIPGLLAELNRRSLPVFVFSNKPDADTRNVIRHCFPEIDFAAVVGSLPGVPLKPDPAGALVLAERFSLSPGAVAYLGDTDVDMRCAVRAGMRPFGVLWGFRDSAELLAGGASVLLDKPSDLLSFL